LSTNGTILSQEIVPFNKKENMFGLHLFFFMLYYKLCKYMIGNHQLRGY